MPPDAHSAVPSAVRLALYNAVPNVLWSALSLVPLSVFCYQHLPRPWLYGMLAVSLLAYVVPRSWFRYWQLGATPRLYQRLGVPFVNQLTQHGGLLHALIRRRYPHYRHVRNRAALRALTGTSYQQERFHLGLLVFVGFVTLFALATGHAGWALVLLLINIGYNLYPIWLQQYLRLRLARTTRP